MENKLNWIEDCYQCYNEDNWISKRKYRKAAVVQGDHEHCLIDAKRLSRHNYPDGEKQGYRSTDGCIWLCESCFNEIQKQHKLSVIKNTAESIENSLSAFKTVVFSLKNRQYVIEKNQSGSITVKSNADINEYDSIASMECSQLFYGKKLNDIIDEIFVGTL